METIFRHNKIRDVLFSAALSAALSPSKEASGIVPNSCSRPADILLPNWSQGHHAALDISVIFPLQQITFSGAALLPGHTLQVCTQRKLFSHLSTCRSAGIDFIPMVVEALGGWSSEAVINIKRIREALGLHSNPPCPAWAAKHRFGHLGIAMWRGMPVLGCIMRPRIPPSQTELFR